MLEALGSIPAPHSLYEMVLIPALKWGRGSAVQGFKVILGYIVSSRGEGGKRERALTVILYPLVGSPAIYQQCPRKYHLHNPLKRTLAQAQFHMKIPQ